MRPRIISIKTLKDKNYDILETNPYYTEMFGEIESKTSIFCYGSSGSGKSVWVMQLANFFAEKHGKALYVSHEEALKKTMQSRANNFNIDAKRLYIGAGLNFDTLVDKITRNYYRMYILDSVQYMKFTYNQLKELNALFAKRKIIPVLVSFGKSYKNPSCDHDIMHACDIKIYFDKGVATVDSRYLDQPKKVRLFDPQRTGIVEPKLF